MLLWRDGRFDAIFDRLTPEVARPSATWMESRKASELKGAIQASETAPVPDFENEIEKAEKQQRSEVASPQLSGDASEE